MAKEPQDINEIKNELKKMKSSIDKTLSKLDKMNDSGSSSKANTNTNDKKSKNTSSINKSKNNSTNKNQKNSQTQAKNSSQTDPQVNMNTNVTQNNTPYSPNNFTNTSVRGSNPFPVQNNASPKDFNPFPTRNNAYTNPSNIPNPYNPTEHDSMYDDLGFGQDIFGSQNTGVAPEQAVPTVKGVFDGLNMVTEHNEKYAVPHEFIVDWNLLQGDELIMEVKNDTQFFKVSKRIPENRIEGVIAKKGESLVFLNENGKFNILQKAIEQYNLVEGCEVRANVPQDQNTDVVSIVEVLFSPQQSSSAQKLPYPPKSSPSALNTRSPVSRPQLVNTSQDVSQNPKGNQTSNPKPVSSSKPSYDSQLQTLPNNLKPLTSVPANSQTPLKIAASSSDSKLKTNTNSDEVTTNDTNSNKDDTSKNDSNKYDKNNDADDKKVFYDDDLN